MWISEVSAFVSVEVILNSNPAFQSIQYPSQHRVVGLLRQSEMHFPSTPAHSA